MFKAIKYRNLLLISTFFILMSCNNPSSSNNLTGQNNTTTIKNTHPGRGIVTVIGDSLAAGYKATNDQVKPAGCLAQLPNDLVKDIAVPGFTSEQILSLMNANKNQKTNLIFISSGGNDTMKDYAQTGTYPAQQSLQEMDTLFETALSTGAVVAYLGLNPPVPYAARLPQISDLAKSKGIIVIDGMNGLWNDSSKMADQIHPNNDGYAIMCDRTLIAISPYYP